MSYNKVISLLKNELDWKSICFEVAAEHPEIFLEAYEASHPDKVRAVVIQALENNPCRKIHAIKECRSVSCMDLKTAKEYVEKIMKELGI
jgi:ribosomal protein L7/L12